MDLGSVFEFAVERFPNKIALVQDHRAITFRELSEEVNRLASSLQKLGVVKRDRIMFLLKNRIETVCLFWAVQKLGAIYTPINLRLSPEDTQYCMNDAEPKIVLYEKLSQRSVMGCKFNERPILISLEQDGGGDLSYRELAAKGSSDFTALVSDSDDIAVMLYTSGTTGVPKGVPRFHRNEYAATMAHIVQNRYEMFESTLGVMPLYHTMGIRSLLSMCVLNGKYVLTPDFDARKSLSLLSEENISCLYMFPTMYRELLTDPRFLEFDLSALKKIGYAGASMSEALTKKCFEMLKPDYFINHYGSTEIYTFTFCSNLDKKPGCAGRPGIHQKIRLMRTDADAASENVTAPGEVGEIAVRADSIEAFKGYWNRPDATRKAIRNHWYYTGDLGYFDEDGDLYVVGRADEMVISGGENISPTEIEEVLLQHPKVLEAAVIGEEDERWGQIVAAFIVPRDDAVTAQELDQFCKGHPKLSSFKRPRKYCFISEIPKNATGKILRRELYGDGMRSVLS